MKSRRIAKQRALQAHRKSTEFAWIDWAIDPNGHPFFELSASASDAQLAPPLPRPKRFGAEPEVEVHVELHYPLTESVPVEERTMTFPATCLLDVCRQVRARYEHLYAEDRKLGGKTADETKAEDPTWRLMNRKTGPWIWGHDMSDLVLEGVELRWQSPTRCTIDLLVGS